MNEFNDRLFHYLSQQYEVASPIQIGENDISFTRTYYWTYQTKSICYNLAIILSNISMMLIL